MPPSQRSRVAPASDAGSALPAPERPAPPARVRRPQAERSAATQRQLIDATVACLNELGYQQTTVEVVAARANVSRGAVQHHFGLREDLILAVVEDLGRALSVDIPIPRTLTLEQRVDAIVRHNWDILRSSQFVAVVQIWLAERANQQLFSTIQNSVTQVERLLDHRWVETFSDLPLSSGDISALRHVVLASLRGLALRNIYRGKKASWGKEIEILKSMVLHTLSQ